MGLLSKVVDMMRVRWLMATTSVTLRPEQHELRFCYDTLQHVSRSFAVVIMQLKDEPLRDGICVFYLVLRALDTLEDDMRVPVETKLRELPKFHTHLVDPVWHLDGVGTGHERALLEQFALLSAAYRQLRPAYRDVIADICARMASGMCDFLQRPVLTRADYDLYCHYVAGLVGHGLTRLFACCGFENAHLADDLRVANHMGLFLQKTNIIRDYYEDVCEDPPRVFWPREVWSTYVDAFAQMREASAQPAALRCLNAMVADALTHMPYVIDYLAQLRDPSVFRFCAIPQVMAMATLALVYNNPRTFTEKVKMSRAETCRVMLRCGSLCDVLHHFRTQCTALLARLDGSDVANTAQLRQQLHAILAKMDSEYTTERSPALYSRSLLLRYPALGGRLVLAWVDSVAGFFGGGGGIGSSGTPRLDGASDTAEAVRRGGSSSSSNSSSSSDDRSARTAQPIAA